MYNKNDIKKLKNALLRVYIIKQGDKEIIKQTNNIKVLRKYVRWLSDKPGANGKFLINLNNQYIFPDINNDFLY